MAAVGYAERERIRQEQGESSFSNDRWREMPQYLSDSMCVGFLQITGVRANTRMTPPPAPNRTVPHLHMIPTHGLHQ